jgi:hypothetical protein
MTTISERLEDAADYIEVHGHCKGALENSDGNVCALGAIDRVAPAVGLFTDVRHAFRQFLGSDRLVDFFSIAAWNNAPERTPQEVIDAFRGAAKHERMKEEGLV